MAKSNFKITFNAKKLQREIERQFERRLKSTGSFLVDYLKEKLDGPRTGRWYPLPIGPRINPRDFTAARMYQASAVGEYPAKRLGDLKETLEYHFVRELNGDLCVYIGSPMEYAVDLEFDKRPFLNRAMLENLDEIKSMIGSPFDV